MQIIEKPSDIEKRSFEIISEELDLRKIVLPIENEKVIKRVIHTTADFDYTETLTFSNGAVEIAKNLIIHGADIVTDTQMAFAGINKAYLLDSAVKRVVLWQMRM